MSSDYKVCMVSCKGAKYASTVRQRIYNKIKNGKIKLSIETDEGEIDIREELASLASFWGKRNTQLFVQAFFTHMSKEDLEKVSYEYMYDKYFNKHGGEAVILNAISLVDSIYQRYVALNALIMEHPASTDCIIMSVCKAIDLSNASDSKDYIYGIDKCMIASILYWAKQNGILKDTIELLDIDKVFKNRLEKNLSYKDTILDMDEKFSKCYYDYKIGKITALELKKQLVTENGALPDVPDYLKVTSPEFSFRCVNEVTEEGTLTDKDYPEEAKKAISFVIQHYYKDITGTLISNYRLLAYGLYSFYHDKEVTELKTKLKNFQNMASQSKEKEKNAKEIARVAKKEVSKLSKENKQQKISIDSLNGQINKLKSAGLRDVEPFKREIEKRGNRIKVLEGQLNNEIRIRNKKDSIISELEKNTQELKRTINEMAENNMNDRQMLNNALMNGGDGSIPLECIAHSLRHKKIAIIGGGNLQTKLKSLGFKHLILVDEEGRGSSERAIRACDLIVIAADCVAHLATFMPKNIAEKEGIPIMYFTGQNIGKLCRELFIQFNKIY